MSDTKSEKSASTLPTPNSSRAQKWLERLLGSPQALGLLFVLSMLESIIIPIPLEVVLIPFMMANRHRIWTVASVVLAGCLVGATIGYFAGMFLFESIGVWFIEYFNYGDAFETFQLQMESHGFWAVFAVGVVPIPFQVAMLAAGLTGYSYVLFMVASALSRGIRYYGLALLVLWLGEPALRVWEKHSKQVGIGLLVLLAGGLGVYLLW